MSDEENNEKGSNSPVINPEVTEAVVAANEFQNGPRTSSVNGSTPSTWKRKACKDMVPRNLENKSVAGSRMMSNLGLNYAIGPDKVPTVFANEQNLWNGTPQVISYFFMGGNKLQHEKVTQAIDEWTWYANISFMEASSAEGSNVRITFDANDGSWSYIGRQCDNIPATEATMNLAWLDKYSGIAVNEKAVILHQFGHALGLLHEHQSPARRNGAVQNIPAALKLYKGTQGWTEQQIYDQIINVYNKSDVSNYSQVDVHSIMHYPQPKELTGLDEDIPYNAKLSDLDKAYMILLYPRKTMHPQAAKDWWSIEKALKVIGAPADVTRKVLTLVKEDVDDFGQIFPVNIREVIENWTRATHGLIEDGGRHSAPLRGTRPATTGPSHAENPDLTPANLPSDSGNGSFIYQLYDKLSTLYRPGGGQYFALQFPTRSLDKENFAYELGGYYSLFSKPVPVAEAEFNLTDDLYAPSPIVGGPNGQKLSQNYSKALNSLVPTFESAEVRKQRERMREWLLKEIKPGNAGYTGDTRLPFPGLSNDSAMQFSRGMTRMEFSESLMQAYLRDRQEWEEQKDKMISEASHLAATDPRAMNDLTRRLAHISALQDAKLSAKYGDAVARGHTHTVRGFLGHLDVKSVAESLQDAKDSLRESALSSLYTASNVYPVTMQPTDWFQDLDTGFTREELSQDPLLIKAAIAAKAQIIDNLENQIANLRGFNKGDPTAAKAAVNEAAAQREAAIAELSRKYTASTISAVKLAIAATAATASPAAAGAGTSSVAIEEVLKKPSGNEDRNILVNAGITIDDLKDIGKHMDEIAEANAAVNSASRALTESMSSLAIAGDTRTTIDGLQRQLNAAKKELSELQQSYMIAASIKTSGSPTVKLEDIANLPSSNGGSRWNEVHVKSTVSNDYTKPVNEAGKDFNCNFWIGSNSESQVKAMSDRTLNVDVSMRVTNVTVDRSAWFDPSVLEMSKSFMKSPNYAPWSTWKTGSKIEDAAKAITDNDQDKKPEGYLVAFPVGYILAKDCVIKVNSDDKSMKEFIDKQLKSSDGFLCFSSRSSLDRSSTSIASASDGVVIRIPGPQILGYIMQLTSEDKSQEFSEVPTQDLFPEDPEDSAPRPDAPPNGTTVEERAVRNYEEESATNAHGSSTWRLSGPVNGVQEPTPGHIVDALRKALDSGDFADWAKHQPEAVKDEILAKVMEAFGKAAGRKQG